MPTLKDLQPTRGKDDVQRKGVPFIYIYIYALFVEEQNNSILGRLVPLTSQCGSNKRYQHVSFQL